MIKLIELNPFTSHYDFENTLNVKVGDLVTMRCIDPNGWESKDNKLFHVLYNGYISNFKEEAMFLLGAEWFSAESLFTDWQWCDKNGEWHTFGIEKNEDDYDDIG